MPTNKTPALPSAALALALTLTACGGTGTGTQPDGQFTYGLLYPQTGSLAFLASAQLSAAEYAVAEINEAGGILGTPVPDIVEADEAGEAGQANEAANNLIGAQVNAVIGAAASGMTQATYGTITSSQTVQCSGSNTSPDLSNINDGGYYFRTAPSDLMAGPVLAQRIVDNDHTGVALVARADDYGTGYLSAVESELRALGANITITETYDPDTTNFGGVISSVLASEADAVALISFEEGTQIMAALIESGEIDGSQFYLTDGLNDPELAATIGAASPDALTGTSGVAPSADNPEFNQGLREFDPELEVFQFAPQVFDCVTAIALAAEAAGSVEPSEYVRHLPQISRPAGTECFSFAQCRDLLDQNEEIDYQGTSGNIDFNDNGDPTSATFEIFQFGENGYEILEYVDYAYDD